MLENVQQTCATIFFTPLIFCLTLLKFTFLLLTVLLEFMKLSFHDTVCVKYIFLCIAGLSSSPSHFAVCVLVFAVAEIQSECFRYCPHPLIQPCPLLAIENKVDQIQDEDSEEESESSEDYFARDKLVAFVHDGPKAPLDDNDLAYQLLFLLWLYDEMTNRDRFKCVIWFRCNVRNYYSLSDMKSLVWNETGHRLDNDGVRNAMALNAAICQS